MAAIAAQIEELIYSAGLDDRAADALRNAKPNVQEAVLDRGDLRDTKNPSSAVMGRLRDAQSMANSGKGGGGMGAGTWVPPGYGGRDAKGNWGGRSYWEGKGSGSGARDPLSHPKPGSASNTIEEFIIDNGLDERAVEAISSCSASVQRAIMDRGDVKDCRNPSSAILGRIKDAKLEVQLTGPGATQDEIETFIAENGLDERASEVMRTCDVHVARLVIDRGELKSAGNPSGAVMCRIRDAQTNKGGKGGGSGGKDAGGAGGYGKAGGYGGYGSGGKDAGGYGGKGGYGGDSWRGDDWEGGMMEKIMELMSCMKGSHKGKGKGKGKGKFPY